MRRKAPVLVDGEPQAAALCAFDQLPPDCEILDERLLRQDVLASDQRPPHQIDPRVGVGRDVDHLYGGIAENGVDVAGNPRLREKGVPASARVIEIARRDRDHVESVARIGFQMRAADPAGPDERDPSASAGDREGPARGLPTAATRSARNRSLRESDPCPTRHPPPRRPSRLHINEFGRRTSSSG